MKELTEEQTQLIQSPQISQTNQNSNSEDAEFDGYSETYSNDTDLVANINSEEVDAEIESPRLQPNRLCHIF